VDASSEPGVRRESQESAEGRPTNPPRPRGGGTQAPAGNAPRQAPESRRRRGNEPRFVAFADGLERVLCAHCEHLLPTTFPVASRGGAATIQRAVVARRGEALLLCTFTHCGPHVWPDGDFVTEEETEEG
jgi:hypothetical protein